MIGFNVAKNNILQIIPPSGDLSCAAGLEAMQTSVYEPIMSAFVQGGKNNARPLSHPNDSTVQMNTQMLVG